MLCFSNFQSLEIPFRNIASCLWYKKNHHSLCIIATNDIKPLFAQKGKGCYLYALNDLVNPADGKDTIMNEILETIMLYFRNICNLLNMHRTCFLLWALIVGCKAQPTTKYQDLDLQSCSTEQRVVNQHMNILQGELYDLLNMCYGKAIRWHSFHTSCQNDYKNRCG